MIKRAALILQFALLLAFGGIAHAQTATPTPPYCATPNPATATPVPTYETKVLSYNPIAYWPISETAGTIAIDQTGNGRHGTITGATLNATTFLNGDPAPSFDGVNDLININTLGSAFNETLGTLSGWIYPVPSYQNDGALNIVKGTTFSIFRTATTNGVRFQAAGSGNVDITVPTDQWVHIAISWSQAANDVRFYINGTFSTNRTGTFTTGSLTTALLGTFAGGYWQSYLSNFAIFDTALTAGQIADLYVVPSSSPATPTATPDCVVFNPTATPTADLWDYWTLPAPSGTPGQAVAIKYEMTTGDISTSIVGLIIVMWLIIFTVVNLIRRR